MDNTDYQFHHRGLNDITEKLERLLDSPHQGDHDKVAADNRITIAHCVGVARALNVNLIETHQPQMEDLPF